MSTKSKSKSTLPLSQSTVAADYLAKSTDSSSPAAAAAISNSTTIQKELHQQSDESNIINNNTQSTALPKWRTVAADNNDTDTDNNPTISTSNINPTILNNSKLGSNSFRQRQYRLTQSSRLQRSIRDASGEYTPRYVIMKMIFRLAAFGLIFAVWGLFNKVFYRS